MEKKDQPIITQVYQMRNDALNDEGFQHFVAQQKSILENLPGNVQLVLARPKSATSLARKYHKEPEKYSSIEVILISIISLKASFISFFIKFIK